MQILKLTKNNQQRVLRQALQVLKQGGLIIYPTETVYGAGVDATNQLAVNKLLAYKTRREGKPLSIAVADQSMASQFALVNQQAQEFYKKFLPGPYTIISLSKTNLAQGVASEFNTIGIRIPDYPFILQLVKLLQKPITATSANASGKKRPYQINDLLKNLTNKQKSQIDLIIDAGELPKNEPSIVIDTSLSTPLTMRDTGKKFKLGQKKSKKLSFISQTTSETEDIAGKILLKNWQKIKEKGLIIGLDGELGAGKTIFAKGIAKFLKISTTITSPTYNYLNEYSYNRHNIIGKFYHLDLWKVETADELERLQINQLQTRKNVVALEWWSHINTLKPSFKPEIIIKIEVLANQQRKITFIEA